MNKALSPLFHLSLCTLGCLYASSTQAQVTSDGTVNTQVNQNGDVAEITEGQTRGDNLFHSFQEFSVGTGNEAFFNNATDIANIFSRVTGGNISSIDGLIRANGSANLFLINPAGILFGENAKLNIGGSFYGSSADSVLFEDGEFSAVNNLNQPILTINAPIGLGFRDNPESIQNNSTASADFSSLPSFDDGKFGLRVPDGKTFALAGGNITADGGGIVAFGGRIELAAVGGEGTLGLTSNGDDFSFSFPNNLPQADVTLTNQASFLVAADGGGDIVINARNINILENSSLNAGIAEGLGAPDAQAGNIVIQSENLLIKDGSQINATVDGKGNSGDLLIKATKLVELTGENNNEPGGIFNQVNFTGEGDAGNLTIETQKLKVGDGSRVAASTTGRGNAGNLTIRAADIEVFETPNKNFFRTGIFATSFRAQRPGSLEFVNNSNGNAGNLTIETERLSLKNGGQVSVTTDGVGNAGNLTVKATESIKVIGIEDPDIFEGSLQNESAITAANEGGSGNSGSLQIETKTLEVADGGQVSVATDGIGNAGDLSIKATDSITLRGQDSGIFAQATPEAKGRGGNINIKTGSLSLTDNAQLTAATPLGLGGNINLNVDDSITLQNNSLISAQAFNNGGGGNVNIDTRFIVAFPSNGIGNDLVATAQQGRGGNINLNAEQIFGLETGEAINDEGDFIRNNNNDLDASSDVLGFDGSVNINTSDINPVQGATELPNNVVEAKQTADQTCSADRDGKVNNGLAIAGRGGVTPPPDAPLNSENINNENPAQTSIPEPIETAQGKIQPARGIKFTKDGRIILTAYPTNNAGERIPEVKNNCGQI